MDNVHFYFPFFVHLNIDFYNSKQSITADIYSHVLDESLKLQSKKESEITLNLI